jgi:nucleotide-binding universal stress UspA family protein
MGGWRYIPPELLERSLLMDRARSIVDDAVDRLNGASAGVVVERVAVEGPAARVLSVASRDADLLVLGSRGRAGLAAVLLGTTGRQSVQQASCPVVTVGSRVRGSRAE